MKKTLFLHGQILYQKEIILFLLHIYINESCNHMGPRFGHVVHYLES